MRGAPMSERAERDGAVDENRRRDQEEEEPEPRTRPAWSWHLASSTPFLSPSSGYGSFSSSRALCSA